MVGRLERPSTRCALSRARGPLLMLYASTTAPRLAEERRWPIAPVRCGSERCERLFRARAQEAAGIAEHRHELGNEAFVVGRVLRDHRADLMIARAEAFDEDVV